MDESEKLLSALTDMLDTVEDDEDLYPKAGGSSDVRFHLNQTSRRSCSGLYFCFVVSLSVDLITCFPPVSPLDRDCRLLLDQDYH